MANQVRAVDTGAQHIVVGGEIAIVGFNPKQGIAAPDKAGDAGAEMKGDAHLLGFFDQRVGEEMRIPAFIPRRIKSARGMGGEPGKPGIARHHLVRGHQVQPDALAAQHRGFPVRVGEPLGAAIDIHQPAVAAVICDAGLAGDAVHMKLRELAQ